MRLPQLQHAHKRTSNVQNARTPHFLHASAMGLVLCQTVAVITVGEDTCFCKLVQYDSATG